MLQRIKSWRSENFISIPRSERTTFQRRFDIVIKIWALLLIPIAIGLAFVSPIALLFLIFPPLHWWSASLSWYVRKCKSCGNRVDGK